MWSGCFCGSSLIIRPADDDTSPTSNPVLSQILSHREELQYEPTAENASTFTTVCEPVPTGVTELNITSEPELCVSDQVCQPTAPSIAVGVLMQY